MTPREAYQAGLAMLRARLFGRPTPLVVGWAITDRCSLRCRYCGLGERHGPALTAAQAIRLADELISLGCARVSFTGGEPLLREDLPRLIERLHRGGVRVKVNSNGARVPALRAALAPVARLTLSLDGPAEVHDAIRGPGSHRQVMDAVDSALESSLPFDFAAVLSSRNLDHVDDLIDLAAALGTRVGFQPATTTRLGKRTPNPLCPPVAAYRRTLDHLIRERQRGRPGIAHSVATLRRLRRWPDPNPMVCASGWISARIQPNGEVVHCSRAPAPRTDRNVGTQGFAAAFAALGPRACDACYCASRIELNLAYGLHPSTLWSQLRGSTR